MADYEMLMERIEALSDELSKIKRALEATKNGVSFTEAFNDELYFEERSDKTELYKKLTTLMEHLLKLKYCTNNRNHGQWRTTISRSHYEVYMDIQWETNKGNNLSLFLIDEIDNIYNRAIFMYKDLDSRKYPDLKQGIKYIPSKCPWSLENLMNDDIHELLRYLPDMDNGIEFVQMQTDPRVCVYLHDDVLSEEIINKTCSQCYHYPDCVSRYYEL